MGDLAPSRSLPSTGDLNSGIQANNPRQGHGKPLTRTQQKEQLTRSQQTFLGSSRETGRPVRRAPDFRAPKGNDVTGSCVKNQSSRAQGGQKHYVLSQTTGHKVLAPRTGRPAGCQASSTQEQQEHDVDAALPSSVPTCPRSSPTSYSRQPLAL